MRIEADGVRINQSLEREFERECEDRLPVPATGTALVPVNPAPIASEGCFREARNVAAFLAQLIGTAQHAPATRTRRRIEPAQGAGVYRKMAAISGVPKRYKMRPY